MILTLFIFSAQTGAVLWEIFQAHKFFFCPCIFLQFFSNVSTIPVPHHLHSLSPILVLCPFILEMRLLLHIPFFTDLNTIFVYIVLSVFFLFHQSRYIPSLSDVFHDNKCLGKINLSNLDLKNILTSVCQLRYKAVMMLEELDKRKWEDLTFVQMSFSRTVIYLGHGRIRWEGKGTVHKN